MTTLSARLVDASGGKKRRPRRGAGAGGAKGPPLPAWVDHEGLANVTEAGSQDGTAQVHPLKLTMALREVREEVVCVRVLGGGGGANKPGDAHVCVRKIVSAAAHGRVLPLWEGCERGVSRGVRTTSVGGDAEGVWEGWVSVGIRGVSDGSGRQGCTMAIFTGRCKCHFPPAARHSLQAAGRCSRASWPAWSCGHQIRAMGGRRCVVCGSEQPQELPFRSSSSSSGVGRRRGRWWCRQTRW